MMFDRAAIDAQIAVGNWQLPAHSDFKVCLTDHRGRVFDVKFFTAGDSSKPGMYVWGVSRSGKTRIVAWPARSEKGRRCYSPTRHFGWTKDSKAQIVADVLAEAIAYLNSTNPSRKP